MFLLIGRSLLAGLSGPLIPCKVAAAGDERYLACAAGAGWLRPSLGVVRAVLVASMSFLRVLSHGS